MDIRQLRYFLAVVKEGQITRAAKTLNMEQPPLSRQIKLMEEELNAALFDRNGKRLKLTQAGEHLRSRAESILRQFHEAIQEVKEVDEGVKGVLSIGAVVSCISLLPPKIEAFRTAYPGVTFKISEGDHFLLWRQLEERAIELIAARLPFEASSDTSSYAVLALPSDPFVAILPENRYVPADQGEMELGELVDVPFLTLKTDETTGMHNLVMEACRKHGFEPEIICECSSVAIIMALVAEGIGATIFPKSVMASFPLPGIRVLPIRDAGFRSDVGILWLKDRYLSKSARRFIDSFRAGSDSNENDKE